MRILCITSMHASITNVRPEAEWFIGLQRAGAQVTLMTEADAPYAAISLEAGIEVVDFRTRGKFDRRAIANIRSQLDNIDIVFAMNNKTIGNAVLAVRRTKVRLVTYRGQTGNVSRWDPSCYLTHLNRRVDAIVCVADAVRRSVAAELRAPEKAVTIYKGHKLGWYEVEAIDVATIGIDDDAPRVICVSNYRRRKGIESLIDCFAHIGTPAHLILVGNGMQDSALARRALAHIDASNFHALGYQPEALAFTAAADIAVLPALRREGLPKTIIEAMACGVVPVVTDTGGNAELVVDGESGLVVPPGDDAAMAAAIETLCKDAGLRRTLGANARERIRTHFRIEDTVSQTIDLFRRLLDRD